MIRTLISKTIHILPSGSPYPYIPCSSSLPQAPVGLLESFLLHLLNPQTPNPEPETQKTQNSKPQHPKPTNPPDAQTQKPSRTLPGTLNGILSATLL